MQDKKPQNKVAELEKLKEKNLPDNVKKSIEDKQKHIAKPFNK